MGKAAKGDTRDEDILDHLAEVRKELLNLRYDDKERDDEDEGKEERRKRGVS